MYTSLKIKTLSTKGVQNGKLNRKKEKIQALMQHLKEDGYNKEEIEKLIYDGDYIVLTDEEADEAAADYIKESVWAFNKSFLDSHSEAIAEIDDKSFAELQEGCESVNKAIWAMIDDKKHFIDDAILCDGRGHFLSSYDGQENEEKVNDTWYFIYRCN